MRIILIGIIITISLVSCNPREQSGVPAAQPPALQTDTPSPIPATQTYTPIPTYTPEPTIISTSTPTPDPEKEWPEFPIETPPEIFSGTIVMNPYPESIYGVPGSYVQAVAIYSVTENIIKIIPEFNGPEINIEITGSDDKWTYMSINSVKMKVRPGTLLNILCVPEGMNSEAAIAAQGQGGVAEILFDPVEKKFAQYLDGTYEIPIPGTTWRINVYFDGHIETGEYYPVFQSRREYCLSFYTNISSWEWEDGPTIYSPWINGCPGVELVK